MSHVKLFFFFLFFSFLLCVTCHTFLHRHASQRFEAKRAAGVNATHTHCVRIRVPHSPRCVAFDLGVMHHRNALRLILTRRTRGAQRAPRCCLKSRPFLARSMCNNGRQMKRGDTAISGQPHLQLPAKKLRSDKGLAVRPELSSPAAAASTTHALSSAQVTPQLQPQHHNPLHYKPKPLAIQTSNPSMTTTNP